LFICSFIHLAYFSQFLAVFYSVSRFLCTLRFIFTRIIAYDFLSTIMYQRRVVYKSRVMHVEFVHLIAHNFPDDLIMQ
jgi:hypothetical protein